MSPSVSQCLISKDSLHLFVLSFTFLTSITFTLCPSFTLHFYFCSSIFLSLFLSSFLTPSNFHSKSFACLLLLFLLLYVSIALFLSLSLSVSCCLSISLSLFISLSLSLSLTISLSLPFSLPPFLYLSFSLSLTLFLSFRAITRFWTLWGFHRLYANACRSPLKNNVLITPRDSLVFQVKDIFIAYTAFFIVFVKKLSSCLSSKNIKIWFFFQYSLLIYSYFSWFIY